MLFFVRRLYNESLFVYIVSMDGGKELTPKKSDGSMVLSSMFTEEKWINSES